jgi:hypothetical protein
MITKEQTVMSIKYPSMRAELSSYARDVARASAADLPGSRESLDYLVHFLFDDTTLAENANSTVGWILKSPEEAECLKALASALDRFLEAFPGNATPENAFTDPLWKEVQRRSEVVAALVGE